MSSENKHTHPSLSSKHYRLSSDTLIDFSRYTDQSAVYKLSDEDLRQRNLLNYRISFLCTLVNSNGAIDFLTAVIKQDYETAFDKVRHVYKKFCVTGVRNDKDREIRDSLIDLAIENNPEGITWTLRDALHQTKDDPKIKALMLMLMGRLPDERIAHDGRNLAYLRELLETLSKSINTLFKSVKHSKEAKCSCDVCVLNGVMIGNFVKCIFYSVFPDTTEFDNLLAIARARVEEAARTGKLPSGKKYERGV